MSNHTVQIPNEAAETFQTVADWVANDLYEQDLHNPAARGTITYLLPETIYGGTAAQGAKIHATAYSNKSISIQLAEEPDTTGTQFPKTHITNAEFTSELLHPIIVAAHYEARD